MPVDIGGSVGYTEFLEAVTDPNHRDHRSALSFCGGTFDAEEFDLGGVNIQLAREGLTEWTHLERFTPAIPIFDETEVYPGGFNHRDEANALMVLRSSPIEPHLARRDFELRNHKTVGGLSETKTIKTYAKTLAELLRLRDNSPDLYKQYLQEYGRTYCRFWNREQ